MKAHEYKMRTGKLRDSLIVARKNEPKAKVKVLKYDDSKMYLLRYYNSHGILIERKVCYTKALEILTAFGKFDNHKTPPIIIEKPKETNKSSLSEVQIDSNNYTTWCPIPPRHTNYTQYEFKDVRRGALHNLKKEISKYHKILVSRALDTTNFYKVRIELEDENIYEFVGTHDRIYGILIGWLLSIKTKNNVTKEESWISQNSFNIKNTLKKWLMRLLN